MKNLSQRTKLKLLLGFNSFNFIFGLLTTQINYSLGFGIAFMNGILIIAVVILLAKI